MCTVLFIIVLLLGVMMPAMQSAFVEKAVRDDTHQLALMVKTAMLQSADQNRNYVIDLTSTTASLHPAGDASAPDDNTASAPAHSVDDSDKSQSSTLDDVVATSQFDKSDKLMIPDPHKPNGWVEMPATLLVCKPGQLCPVPRVRMSQGDAWLEIGFNALTGNVENETAYFP